MCTALSYFSDRSQTAICQPFGNHWMRPLPDYRGCCWNSLSMTLRYVLSQENSRTFQTALAENLSVKLNHLTTRRRNRRQSCWETCNRKQHPEKIQGQHWWDITSGDGVCFEMMTFRKRTSWCFYPRILEFQSREGFRGWHVIEIRPNCSPKIIESWSVIWNSRSTPGRELTPLLCQRLCFVAYRHLCQQQLEENIREV